MADETEPGLLAQPFTIETGVGVGGRGVRVIGSMLAVKVPLAVASGAGWLARAVLWAKAFEARPGFQQGAVDREMIARQQGFDPGLGQHRGEKLPGHLALQQPVAILGEGGGIPHRILDAKPDKPAKQQVVVEPVNQLPLRADRIERLQQQSAQAAPAGSTPGQSANTAWQTRQTARAAPRWRSAESTAADDPS